jgi:hypothetical protein
MADAQKTVEELTQEKARLELERDVAKTQAEVLAAQAQVAVAQNPPSKSAAEAAADAKAKFDALTAQYSAEKAAAEARTAANAAQVGATIGTVPNSGLSGAVSVKTDAGKGEATLLSAVAVARAASFIARDVMAAAKDSKPRQIIIATGDRPRFQYWRMFVLRQGLIQKAAEVATRLDDTASKADNRLPTPQPGTGVHTEAAPLAVAGAALDALKNLGSFFQSDYEIGGISLSPDDSLLSAAVARDLAAQVQTIDSTRYLPATGDKALQGGLEVLEQIVSPAAQKISSATQRAKDLRARAAKEPNLQESLENVAAMYDRSAAAWKEVSDSYATLLKDLATPDANGVLLAFKVADDQFLSNALADGDTILFLKVNNAVGGYYTKKNLWTFLGGMPFYTMGGAVVSFTLIEGANGKVLAAGTYPVHSGYAKANAVQGLVPSLSAK